MTVLVSPLIDALFTLSIHNNSSKPKVLIAAIIGANANAVMNTGKRCCSINKFLKHNATTAVIAVPARHGSSHVIRTRAA